MASTSYTSFEQEIASRLTEFRQFGAKAATPLSKDSADSESPGSGGSSGGGSASSTSPTQLEDGCEGHEHDHGYRYNPIKQEDEGLGAMADAAAAIKSEDVEGLDGGALPVFSDALSPNGSTNRTRLSSSRWAREDDENLRRLVAIHGAKSWHSVASKLGSHHSAVQCMCRWKNVLSPDVRKGPWSAAEDEIVRELVLKATVEKVKWREVAAHLPGRLGKQCRERWYNQLDPAINTGPWKQDEDQQLLEAQRRHGNRWNKIAKLLAGRTENAVKNRFNSATFRRWKDAIDGLVSKCSESASSSSTPQQGPASSGSQITPNYLDLGTPGSAAEGVAAPVAAPAPTPATASFKPPELTTSSVTSSASGLAPVSAMSVMMEAGDSSDDSAKNSGSTYGRKRRRSKEGRDEEGPASLKSPRAVASSASASAAAATGAAAEEDGAPSFAPLPCGLKSSPRAASVLPRDRKKESRQRASGHGEVDIEVAQPNEREGLRPSPPPPFPSSVVSKPPPTMRLKESQDRSMKGKVVRSDSGEMSVDEQEDEADQVRGQPEPLQQHERSSSLGATCDDGGGDLDGPGGSRASGVGGNGGPSLDGLLQELDHVRRRRVELDTREIQLQRAISALSETSEGEEGGLSNGGSPTTELDIMQQQQLQQQDQQDQQEEEVGAEAGAEAEEKGGCQLRHDHEHDGVMLRSLRADPRTKMMSVSPPPLEVPVTSKELDSLAGALAGGEEPTPMPVEVLKAPERTHPSPRKVSDEDPSVMTPYEPVSAAPAPCAQPHLGVTAVGVGVGGAALEGTSSPSDDDEALMPVDLPPKVQMTLARANAVDSIEDLQHEWKAQVQVR
mmetsp:Transcript_98084/g.280692  ORF Transcript_98084/g.280692 Transcript_98084/m.280692 type:complete len:842 (-) Transcript_98084:241-2766(-)